MLILEQKDNLTIEKVNKTNKKYEPEISEARASKISMSRCSQAIESPKFKNSISNENVNSKEKKSIGTRHSSKKSSASRSSEVTNMKKDSLSVSNTSKKTSIESHVTQKTSNQMHNNLAQPKKNRPSNFRRSKMNTTRKLRKRYSYSKRKDSLRKQSLTRIIPFLITIKDVQTAFMLFVVSIFFIASYTPSILATKSILPNDNLFLIYLYLTNSAVNPIIYSFINRSFRSDLIKLLSKSKPIFAISRLSSMTVYSNSPNFIDMKTIQQQNSINTNV
jgi:hypothetical protein